MKYALVLVAVILAGAASYALAGHFIDVLPPASTNGCTPVSNGYDYNCSNDSGAPAIQAAAPVSLWSRTLTQVQALTPGTTGQIIFCSNCTGANQTKGVVCVSTGVNAGAWVYASSNVVQACQ